MAQSIQHDQATLILELSAASTPNIHSPITSPGSQLRDAIVSIPLVQNIRQVNLNMAWHRLDAWPDVASGLARLRRRYLLAPVSNGNISLMVDLARRNNLPWDAILGAEIARDYKPKPRVYLAAAEAFDLVPSDCMMVAAHTQDLTAAAALAMRTAHIARPNENGSGRGEAYPTRPVDIAARSIEDLAYQFAL